VPGGNGAIGNRFRKASCSSCSCCSACIEA
jgi:hypothetical protein